MHYWSAVDPKTDSKTPRPSTLQNLTSDQMKAGCGGLWRKFLAKLASLQITSKPTSEMRFTLPSIPPKIIKDITLNDNLLYYATVLS